MNAARFYSQCSSSDMAMKPDIPFVVNGVQLLICVPSTKIGLSVSLITELSVLISSP
jgi:hypothetical protein